MSLIWLHFDQYGDIKRAKWQFNSIDISTYYNNNLSQVH